MDLKLCKTGKRIIAGVTAIIYIAGAAIMIMRSDYQWAEVQGLLAAMSTLTAVTL